MAVLQCTECEQPLPWELEAIIRHIAQEEIEKAHTPPNGEAVWAAWFKHD